MTIKLLGATAIAATMLAGSAMAQAVVNEPGRCSAQFPNANCQNLGKDCDKVAKYCAPTCGGWPAVDPNDVSFSESTVHFSKVTKLP